MNDKPTKPARPGFEWVSTELGWWQVPLRNKPKRTPHAQLKAQCRDAMTAWRQRTGANLVLLPSIVGKVKVNDGTRQGREIAVGKRGQADDTLLVGRRGALWAVLGLEYKAGSDRQSEVQRAFQAKWEAAGGIYVVVRSVADVTAALDRVRRP